VEKSDKNVDKHVQDMVLDQEREIHQRVFNSDTSLNAPSLSQGFHRRQQEDTSKAQEVSNLMKEIDSMGKDYESVSDSEEGRDSDDLSTEKVN